MCFFDIALLLREPLNRRSQIMGLSRGKMPICGLGNKPGCLGGGSGHNCRGFSLTTTDTLHVCAASLIQLCKNPVDGSMIVHLMPSASGIAEARPRAGMHA